MGIGRSAIATIVAITIAEIEKILSRRSLRSVLRDRSDHMGIAFGVSCDRYDWNRPISPFGIVVCVPQFNKMLSPRGKWHRIRKDTKSQLQNFQCPLYSENRSHPKLVFPFVPRFPAFSSSNYGHNKQLQSIKRVARTCEPGCFSDRSDRSDHMGIEWSLRSLGSLVTFCGDRSDHMGTRQRTPSGRRWSVRLREVSACKQWDEQTILNKRQTCDFG